MRCFEATTERVFDKQHSKDPDTGGSRLSEKEKKQADFYQFFWINWISD